ncbi:MAG: hypothetical protein K0R41_1597 [Geminicoccaceae bacterium]|nr:hypothetical protein [Geminicoccaceae bacterium]
MVTSAPPFRRYLAEYCFPLLNDRSVLPSEFSQIYKCIDASDRIFEKAPHIFVYFNGGYTIG